MQNIHWFIIFLCIILLSGLGISLYKEGLNCSSEEVESNRVCVNRDTNNNTFIVIIILISFIVWMVMIKQNS